MLPLALRTIEDALRAGNLLHAFLSGGGLRVVRIEMPGTPHRLVAYGEHPHVDEALRITADDYRAGGREYGAVYGKEETHYLTGSPAPNGALDAWIRKGRTWDALFRENLFVCELRGLEDDHTPLEIVNRVLLFGEQVTWTNARGITRVAEQSRFPNGEKCCSTRVLSKPEGMSDVRTILYRVTKTGAAETLHGAIEGALAAESVEVPDNELTLCGMAP
jgi:hypothetical protein